MWALLRRIPGIPGALLLDRRGVIVHAFYGENQTGLPSAVSDFIMSLDR